MYKKLFIGLVASIAALAACQKVVEYYMTLSEKNFTVSAEGGVITFDLKTNTYVRINNDMDWAKIAESSKSGDVTTYSLTVAANPEQTAKEGTVRFIGDYVTPLKLTVHQRPNVPVVITPAEYKAAWSETETSFELVCDKAWTASCDNPRFKLAPTSGEGEAVINVTFPINEDESAHTGTITFKVGNQNYTAVISQAAAPRGIDPAEITVGFGATSAQFKVIANTAWTASCDNAAFVLSQTSGSGEADVTVTFPANEKNEPVVAHVTVKVGTSTYVCTITQEAAPKKEYTDLSAKETSNCYIISDAGYYMFRLERGNGVVPASLAGHFGAFEPKSVFALWSSYNTDTAPASADAFTQELEMKDGYVRFLVPDKIKGNAVIAALDGNGEICWSWHLWFTEKPADIALASCTWMDRNVGAVCAVAAGEVAPANASGFFYSWGRKDPMRGVTTYDLGEEVATAVAPGYSWSSDITIDKKFMVDTFIKTPMTYYEDKGKVWVNTDGSTLTDLWNGETKTMNDPCPAGYRLPSNAENTTLATDNGISLTAKASSAPGDTSYTDNWSGANHTFTFGPVVYPLGGAYVFGGGMVTTYGDCGRYCSSNYNTKTNAYWININATAYNVNNSGALTQGGMARCIKIK